MTTPNISRFTKVHHVVWFHLDTGKRGSCRVWPKQDTPGMHLYWWASQWMFGSGRVVSRHGDYFDFL